MNRCRGKCDKRAPEIGHAPVRGSFKWVDMNITPALFEDYDIRRVYDDKTETWYFSVVDIIRALLQQPDFQTSRNYWKVLKNRLSKEGSESVTNCNRLKLEAADGKKYLTDVASPWRSGNSIV
jgi:hypothetical protein